jgi:two-component system OmpR family sensor kinase
VLTVEDSGPGIAKEAQLRVFDRFFRASDALTETGSGLGLAIVKTIADRHGASFRLDRSERLGGLRVQMRMATAPALD